MASQIKDSAIGWIGETKQDWSILKLSQLFSQTKTKNINLSETNLLSLSYGKVKKRNIESNEGLLPESFDGYNIIEANDIVLRMTDLQNDQHSLRVGISSQKGIITSAYITLRKKNHLIDELYAYYFLHSFDICKGFYGMGAGVRQGVTFNHLKRLEVLVPALDEQKKITEFLDEKTLKIDSIIEDTKKSLDEFKKYKQALITEAVTRGIRSDINVKKNEGEHDAFPNHWEVCKLKYLITFDPSKSEVEDKNKICSFLPMEKLRNGKMQLDLNRTVDEVYSGYSYFRENDVVLAKVTPCFQNGNIAIAKNLTNGIGFGTSEIFTLRATGVETEFLYYVLQEETFKNEAVSTMYGTGGLKRIPAGFILNYKIGLPPISEQLKIVDFLNSKCAHIDSLVEKKQELITELESYKKSMIYEYVTGKKVVL